MKKNSDSEIQEPALVLDIQDLSRGGAGVAKDPDGRVVFVPYTAPGDQVRVRILDETKNYRQGEVVEIIRPSSLRQKPPCSAFGRCGGCQWQHLDYGFQWKTKVSGVRHALKRVGLSVSIPWEELPAERIWEYRNRVQLRGLGDTLGFYTAKSHDVISLNRCEIARPEINAVWEETRKEGKAFKKPYKVEIEVLADGKVRKLWNSAHAAGGFRQVHDEQNEKLRSWVAGALSGKDVLFDLYGGAGNLSLSLSDRFSEIHCVDVSSPGRAPEGTPANFRFSRSPVLNWLLKTNPGASKNRPLSVIADPPREGLSREAVEINQVLRGLGAREWVLVGCDPDAWASDLLKLTAQGWRIERLAVLDLFPQTRHVEALSLLRL